MNDNTTPGSNHPPRRRLSWTKAGLDGAAANAPGVGFPVEAHALSSRPSSSLTFTSVSPEVQDVTVLAGVHGARVQVIGGHGGNSLQPHPEVGAGDGAEVNGTVALTPGQKIGMAVARYGGDSDFNKHPGKGGSGGASSTRGTTSDGNGLVVITWISGQS